MYLVKSLILAFCLTLTLGPGQTRFSVKPSVYLMPEKVFTNQANYDLIKKSRIFRTNQPSLNLFNTPATFIRRNNFQLRMALPDAVAIFFKKPARISSFGSLTDNRQVKNQWVENMVLLRVTSGSLALNNR